MEGWRTGISGGGKRKEKQGWWSREAAHGPVCEASTSATGDVGRWRRPDLGFCRCLLDNLLLTWADVRAQLREFSVCIVFDLSFASFFLMR